MNRLMGVLDKLLLSLSQWFTKSGLSPRSHSVFVAVFHWHCLVQLVPPLHYWGANYYLIRVFVLLTNALVNVYASTATHSSKGEHAQQHVAWLASLPLLPFTALHHWQSTQWPHCPDPQGPSFPISQLPFAQPQLLLASLLSHCPLRRGSAHHWAPKVPSWTRD